MLQPASRLCFAEGRLEHASMGTVVAAAAGGKQKNSSYSVQNHCAPVQQAKDMALPVVRDLNFVRRLVFKLPTTGSILPANVVVGDVDNDRNHDNEIVVAGLCGNLAVYKGRCTEVRR